MEEIKRFVLLLWRYRLILVVVPLLTIAATYYIVRNIPSTYPAQTQIATGIVDETQQMAFSDASDLQSAAITQKFINLTETMKSRPMIEQVSYQLMLHDLRTPDKAFRGPSEDLKKLNVTERKKVIDIIDQKHERREALNINDLYERSVSLLIASMGYDFASILRNL